MRVNQQAPWNFYRHSMFYAQSCITYFIRSWTCPQLVCVIFHLDLSNVHRGYCPNLSPNLYHILVAHASNLFGLESKLEDMRLLVVLRSNHSSKKQEKIFTKTRFCGTKAVKNGPSSSNQKPLNVPFFKSCPSPILCLVLAGQSAPKRILRFIFLFFFFSSRFCFPPK